MLKKQATIDIYNKLLQFLDFKFIAHLICKESPQIKTVEVWAHKDI